MSYLQQHAVEAHGQAAALLLTLDNILLEVGQKLLDDPHVRYIVETGAEVAGDWQFEQAWLCNLRLATEVRGGRDTLREGYYEATFHAAFHGEWQSRRAARGKQGLGPAILVTAMIVLGPDGVNEPQVYSVQELHYEKNRKQRRKKSG